MNTDGIRPILDEIDYLILEAADARSGLTFKIIHRYQRGGVCEPGEEVAMVLLIIGSSEIQLVLSLRLRLVVDFLARNPHRFYDAAQISAGLREPFYARHVANAGGGRKATRRIHRTSVKVSINRLRNALALAFQAAGVNIDPCQIIKSEKLSSNAVGYSLNARAEICHVDPFSAVHSIRSKS